MKCSTTGKRVFYFFSVTKLHYDSTGRLRSYSPLMSDEEWRPFVRKFANIKIFTRIDPSDRSDEGYFLESPNLQVVPLPYYEGILGFYRKQRIIEEFIADKITSPDIYYGLWAPSSLEAIVAKQVTAINGSLLVRLVGDPSGVAASILPSPIKRFGQRLATGKTRATVKAADAVIYVTLKALQGKYPARSSARVLARTNMKFSEELLRIPKKKYLDLTSQHEFSIIAVGSQAQNYKGHDLLISAVDRLQREGYRVRLTLVGTGKLNTVLRKQAERLSADSVTFYERLGSSIDVAREVAEHDIFVMPSRTEGMPKALLEAMSVGVLAIGSRVGGIPEILSPASLFEPNSVISLYNNLKKYIDKPEKITEQIPFQSETVQQIMAHHSGERVLREFLDEWINNGELIR